MIELVSHSAFALDIWFDPNMWIYGPDTDEWLWMWDAF